MLSTGGNAASLSGVDPWLTIDYGAASTRAVLVWPGGRWTLLAFDGAAELSNAVHVSPAAILAGVAAWQQAETEPDGFVLSPLRVGPGAVRVGEITVEVADLVTATLQQVAAETVRLAGDGVVQVRLVVPAGWGPRRRIWLRQAAGKAGLPVAEVVSAPAAAAARGPHRRLEPGQVVLVLDIGAGCEASVLQQDPTGLDVLSVLADADAGGDRIDAALVTAVTGTALAQVPAGRRWPMLAAARAAKHALSQAPAVTVHQPHGPPAVVTTAVLRQAVEPVAEQVVALACEALANADLSIDRVAAVYAIGGSVGTAGMMDTITAKLGVAPTVLQQPATAALLGAADTTPQPSGPVAGLPQALPPLRRLFGLGVCGLASLLLFAHFVFAAEFYNGTPRNRTPSFYVLASWGELTVAAVLAAVTWLQAAALFAAAMTAAPEPSREGPVSRMSTGLGAAIAASAATAAAYAAAAAVYMDQPTSGLLRWALLPLLPTLLAATVLLAAIWRAPGPPAGGWDQFLTFPVSSVLAGAAGIAGIALYWHGQLPAWMNGWDQPLGLAGAVLIGVALACTLVSRLVVRIGLAVLFGFFLLIVSRGGPSIPAIVYALAVTVWWGQRAWLLLRQPVAAYAG